MHNMLVSRTKAEDCSVFETLDSRLLSTLYIVTGLSIVRAEHVTRAKWKWTTHIGRVKDNRLTVTSTEMQTPKSMTLLGKKRGQH